MEDAFCIYVDRLRTGKEEKIEEVFPPDFFEVNGPELSFEKNVLVKGKAYLATDTLILDLNIETEASLPCSICNQKTSVPIVLRHVIHAVPLEEIPSKVYSYRPFLRETILLETPPLIECHEGNCPQRKEITKYMHQTKEGKEELYHPFADFPFEE